MTGNNEITASHIGDNNLGNEIMVRKEHKELVKPIFERAVQVSKDVSIVLDQQEKNIAEHK